MAPSVFHSSEGPACMPVGSSLDYLFELCSAAAAITSDDVRARMRRVRGRKAYYEFYISTEHDVYLAACKTTQLVLGRMLSIIRAWFAA